MNDYLIFGDVDSRDYGVYIFPTEIDDAPKRAYKRQEIAGRSGDLLIDQKRFENIQMHYYGYISGNDYEESLRDFRAALMSQIGYQRLEDSIHSDEYYDACYIDTLVVKTALGRKLGRFEIVFNRKPQRWLKSGEEVIVVGEWGETETVSGGIATFEADEKTKIKSVVAHINPVQDLHGYDNPWPAGGGKNLCLPYSERSSSFGIDYTVENQAIKINGTANGASYSWNSSMQYSDCPIKLNAGTYTFSASAVPGSTQAEGYLAFMGKTENGTAISTIVLAGEILRSVVTFSENVGIYYGFYVANGITVDLTSKIQIEQGSVVSPSYAPYSNVCPISGFTGMNITGTGKNLLNTSLISLINSTAENQRNGIIFDKVGTYTVSAKEAGSGTIYARTYTPTSGYGEATKVNSSGLTPITYTVVAGGRLIVFSAAVENVEDSVAKFISNGIQVEYGSTAHTYEPYQGTAYPITFPQEAGTVYGGYVDVTKGELIVDRARAVLGGGNLTRLNSWYSTDVNNQSWGVYLNAGNDMAQITNETIVSQYFVSDKIKNIWASYGNRAAWTGGVTMNNGVFKYFGIRLAKDALPAVSSSTELIREAVLYLNENPIEFVFKITPKKYDLTPTQINTLLGVNNIWNDTNGDTDVEYGDNPNIISNPTKFESNPLLRVYGTGKMYLGDYDITVSANDDYTDIDCFLMEAYKGVVSKNANVSFGSSGKPALVSGNNIIDPDTMTRVEVTPRWYTI